MDLRMYRRYNPKELEVLIKELRECRGKETKVTKEYLRSTKDEPESPKNE